MTPIHPIEEESYRILRHRLEVAHLDLAHLGPGPRAVVERVIHATADLEYASTMVAPGAAVETAVAALAAGCPVVVDVEMTRAGITGMAPVCYLSQVTATGSSTRSAAAMRLAADRHPDGAVVVIGCAPTALVEAVALAREGRWRPAAFVALPVGFVGAASAKEAARASGWPVISNTGEKGGAAAAAAACNALVRLAVDRSGQPLGPAGQGPAHA